MESKGNTGEVESAGDPRWQALLQNWRNWLHAAQSAYSLEATRFKRWDYLLGFWVVVMSTIIGSSAFAEKDGGFGLPAVMIGMMATLAAIFAALQTFLKLGRERGPPWIGCRLVCFNPTGNRGTAGIALESPRRCAGHLSSCLEITFTNGFPVLD